MLGWCVYSLLIYLMIIVTCLCRFACLFAWVVFVLDCYLICVGVWILRFGVDFECLFVVYYVYFDFMF